MRSIHLFILTPIKLCQAAKTTIFYGKKKIHGHSKIETEEERVHQIFTFKIEKGETATVEKLVCMYFNAAKGILNAKEAAMNQVISLSAQSIFFTLLQVKWFPSYAELEHQHKEQMVLAWEACDIVVKGNDGSSDRLQLITRLHIFHMIQTVSLNTIGYDVSVPARGLHGESYRGRIYCYWPSVLYLFD